TGKLNQVFEDDGIMDSVVYGFAPCERAVAGDKHAGAMQRIATGEGFNDHVAGIDFVIVSDFATVQAGGAGDRSVKIIGVGRAESGNRSATLRPGSGKKAVGMNDTANLAKSPIKYEMRFSI